MRLGLEGANGECRFSCEIDRFARRTYEENFGTVDWDDIRTLDTQSVPDHDVLAAGFPCQPFSLAGVSKRKHLGRPTGLRDPEQGQLFFQAMRIVRAKRPRVVLLENVRNLARLKNGETLELIKRHLRHEGYEPSVALVSSRPWVPQNRLRLIIIAIAGERAFEFPDPPTPSRLTVLADILDPCPDPKFTITDKLWEYLPRYAEKHRLRGNGFGFGLADLQGATRTLSARYHKDGAEILIPQEGKNPRRLTPAECRKLMGFPDGFKIVVSNTQAYRQFGNSVVVPMVEYIAKALISQLGAATASRSQDLVQEAVARVG
jgi:DNA (cytosine-5)-methyltransferase 1